MTPIVPAFIRGRLIDDNLVDFGGRHGDGSFRAPDPHRIVGSLPLADPGALAELHALPFEEIVAYLVALGEALTLDRNPFLQKALADSIAFSDLTEPVLTRLYEIIPSMFAEASVREIGTFGLGETQVDGWKESRLSDGMLAAVRPFGARSAHIVAGNAPAIAAVTILRNIITRSDAIIKLPSNDPFTAIAIAQTMQKIAPDHPLTRHLAIAYWKGGDEAVESRLYQPAHLDKIIAWGGFASVKHITRYLQPGLELVTLDPKRSATLIGEQAFESEARMEEVAQRLAADIGSFNQLACVNARVVFVVSGTDDDGLARVNRLGEMTYRALMELPASLSTAPRYFDAALSGEIEALRSGGDFYRIIGGRKREGAIIVSQIDDPVDFYPSLSGRVANIVPLDSPHDILQHLNSYTQTIGIYPESLKDELRDILPFHGAQRIVSLGYAAYSSAALPQDAIEPLRRMVKWIVDERCADTDVPQLWEPVSNL